MSSPTTFLFSHFGETIPKHLTLNIERTLDLFQTEQIVLVTNAAKAKFRHPNVVVLHPGNLSWNRERPQLSQDMRFWNGWWQKTFDRLFLIRPVHELFPSQSLLQVESDTILFPSFPFRQLAQINKLAWPGYSKDADVASVIYSPNPQLSSRFDSELMALLAESQNTTDMKALNQIGRRIASDYFELPEFINAGSSSKNEPLLESIGLFDGLSHGEWICGRDPRAHWGIGKRKMVTPKSSINSKWPLQYSISQGQLRVKVAEIDYNVHNLHVHSKELYFFSVANNEIVEQIIEKVNQPGIHPYFFNFKAFFFCLHSNLRIWFDSLFSVDAWMRVLRKWQAT
jgi:hypothetical protein